jgi:tRNA modification GTPase
VAISARTGFGLDRLTLRLTAYARARIGGDETPAITHARHRQQLERCRAALSTFLTSPMEEFELRAEDLRRAALALGRITGLVDPEEVLGEIFGRFCIGK